MGFCSPRGAMVAFVIFVSVLSVILPAFGQSENAASLTIRFAGGTSEFRVGEVIPIELAFSAPVRNTYEINTRNYDRSGRLYMEGFRVSPPGRDPLYNYYQGGMFGGFIGGGLGGSQYLSGKPHVIREELNEWVALDKPGHYTVYVTSSRVTRRGGSKPEGVELRSNTLEFEIVEAGPEWQQQALSSAVSVLNSAGSKQEEKHSAIRTLRFLDSPGSVRELVRQVTKSDETGRWDFVAGLIGSRHQELVLVELEARFGAPDTAITADYLRLLAQTKFLLSHGPLPPYPEKDKEEQKSWQKRLNERVNEFSELQDALYRQTVELVAAKQGTARAETVRTLLQRPARGSSDFGPPAGLPEPEVVSSFLKLSPQEQADLLESFWARLKSPLMVEALEKILDQPKIQHARLRKLALQYLHELDPGEAAPRILAEIRQPHVDEGISTVPAKTLSVLPEKTLPEFDQLLAARLEDKNSPTTSLDAQLIGRYATESILSRVKALYESAAGKWSCDIEDGLVSYFLRVDADYGIKRIIAGGGLCNWGSLEAAVRINLWEEVEPAIIKRMDDENLSAARHAAETVARYGGAKAENAMWERLRRFHQQWAGREHELQYSPTTPPDVSEAISFQFGLVEALGKAQGWLLNNDQITELESLTLGSERENVARWHWQSPVSLSITSLFDGQIQAHVNEQYFSKDLDSLRAKLSQYPRGTRFWMNAFGPQDQLAPVIRTINETAGQHGLVIETVPVK